MRRFFSFFTIILTLLLSLGVITSAYSNKTPSKTKLQIFCDEATYDRKNRFAFIKGKVKIIQDNLTIFSDEVRYNERDKISFSAGPVKIIHLDKKNNNRKTVITGSRMTVWHELKKVLLERNVRMDREEDKTYKVSEELPKDQKQTQNKIEQSIKKERTVVTSDTVEYFTEKQDIFFNGNVVVLQKEKKAKGDKATILNTSSTITLEGNTEVIQINGDWLVNEKIIEKPENDIERQRLIKEKFTLLANKIVIYQKTNDLEALGNVTVVQKVGGVKSRTLKSDKAFYSDKDNTLTLIDNVNVQRENNDWLKGTKAILYTNTGDLKIIGQDKQIEAEVTIEESPSPEPIGTSEPLLDLDKHSPTPVLPEWLKNK